MQKNVILWAIWRDKKSGFRQNNSVCKKLIQKYFNRFLTGELKTTCRKRKYGEDSFLKKGSLSRTPNPKNFRVKLFFLSEYTKAVAHLL